MREIKFRAWDKECGEFIYSDEEDTDAWFGIERGRLHAYCIHGMTSGSLHEPPEPKVEVLEPPHQYTGLKDKSGREIFEGDIVEFHSRSYGVFNATIIWNEEKAMFAVTTCYPYKAKQITMPEREWEREHDPCDCDGAMYETVFTPLGNNLDKIKVIGNVYENPELLEE